MGHIDTSSHGQVENSGHSLSVSENGGEESRFNKRPAIPDLSFAASVSSQPVDAKITHRSPNSSVLTKLLDLKQKVDAETTHLKSAHSSSTGTIKHTVPVANVPLSAAEPGLQVDDDFDMFADLPSSAHTSHLNAKPTSQVSSEVMRLDTGLAPNTDISRITAQIGGQQAVAGERDDEDGYFVPRVGELLASRYVIESILGAGVFGCVVRARDTETNKTDTNSTNSSESEEKGFSVAIKLIRANEQMRKAGEKELAILQRLSEVGSKNSETSIVFSAQGQKALRGRKHCIKFLSSFSHHRHLAIITDCMDQSLRKLLNLNPAGVSIDATRVYGRQLFSGLAFIHHSGILHADIKLDNLVISADKRRLKICDFGSALFSHEIPSCIETDQLASRFYRSPEIILGYTPSTNIDVWAAACCLFELYSGKLPFMGDDNNGMLLQFMELLGRFPKKMLTRSRHVSRHFDPSDGYSFICKAQGGIHVKAKVFGRRSLSAELLSSKDRKKMLSNPQQSVRSAVQKVDDLADLLLHQLFIMDGERRSSSATALRHRFFARPKSTQRESSKSRSMSRTRG